MTVRRLKTYTGATGCVYQYYFVGKRAALPDEPARPATEYIFDVSTDGKTIYAVSIFLQDAAVSSWQAEHERELSEPEQYALAKMRLFCAFDEVEKLIEQRRWAINLDEIGQFAEVLGLD